MENIEAQDKLENIEAQDKLENIEAQDKSEAPAYNPAPAFVNLARLFLKAENDIRAAQGRHQKHGKAIEDNNPNRVVLVHKENGKTCTKDEKAAQKFVAATLLLIESGAIPLDVWTEAKEMVKAEAQVQRQMAEAAKAAAK